MQRCAQNSTALLCSAWYCLLLNLSTFLHTLFILHATGTTDLKMENFNFVTTLISIIEFRFDFIHLWMMYICVCSTCILNTNNGYACCASSETGKGETEIESEGKKKKSSKRPNAKKLFPLPTHWWWRTACMVTLLCFKLVCYSRVHCKCFSTLNSHSKIVFYEYLPRSSEYKSQLNIMHDLKWWKHNGKSSATRWSGRKTNTYPHQIENAYCEN